MRFCEVFALLTFQWISLGFRWIQLWSLRTRSAPIWMKKYETSECVGAQRIQQLKVLNFKWHFNRERIFSRKCVTREIEASLCWTVSGSNAMIGVQFIHFDVSPHLATARGTQSFIKEAVRRRRRRNSAAATLSHKTIFTMTHIFSRESLLLLF